MFNFHVVNYLNMFFYFYLLILFIYLKLNDLNCKVLKILIYHEF